jgi:hypothetical protein
VTRRELSPNHKVLGDKTASLTRSAASKRTVLIPTAICKAMLIHFGESVLTIPCES